MRRLTLTHHTVRCPLEDRPACVTVRTDPDGYPSRRHRDVIGCSLLPSAPVVPPARTRYFPDAAPPVPYLAEVEAAPCHASNVACSKRCLAILNAAEPGAAEPARCTSGTSDSLSLAQQTQSPAMMRLCGSTAADGATSR